MLGHSGVIKPSIAVALVSAAILFVFYGIWLILSNITWGMVLTVGLFVAVAYDNSGLFVVLAYIMSAVGIMLAVKHLRVSARDFGSILIMAGLAVFVVIGSEGYTSFDMMQRMHVGQVHKDTLFHASIAAMIKNYGIASTGLNGLVEIHYHTLSHALMGAVSKLSRQSVLETYGIAQSVLLIPLVISSAVLATLGLMEGKKVSAPFIWGAVCLLFHFMPILFGNWGFWNSYFVSESYALAVVVLMLGILPLYKKNLKLLDVFLIVLVSATLVLTKSSVGMIYCGLWGLRALFLSRGWLTIDLLAAVFSTLAVLGGVWSSIGITRAPFYFLHFVSIYSNHGSYISSASSLLSEGPWQYPASVFLLLTAVASLFFFLIFHFLPTWLVIDFCRKDKNWRVLIRQPAMLYLAGSIFAGLFFALLFEIGGGSAFYFTNVSFFVALPVLLGMISRWFVSATNGSDRIAIERRFLRLSLFIVILATAHVLHRGSLNRPPVAGQNLLIEQLVSIRKTAQREVVIDAPADMVKLGPVSECSARPFVYPAVSERPWIGVIRLDEDCVYENYGYEAYNLSSSQAKVLSVLELRGLSLVSPLSFH